MMLRFLSHSKQSAPSGPAPTGASSSDATMICSDMGEVRGLSDLYSPEPTSQQAHVRDAADILLEMNKITDEQYGRLRRELMNRPGMDTTTWLLKEGMVGADDVLQAKAELGGMEFRRITPQEVDGEAFQKLDLTFIQRSTEPISQLERLWERGDLPQPFFQHPLFLLVRVLLNETVR